MIKWFTSKVRTVVSWAMGLAVLLLILFGMKHSAARGQQLRLTQNLTTRARVKLKEVQHAQLEASLSVRGDRNQLVERMQRGKF